MIEFLLKSTLSMAVLLGFYHMLLEREKMHRFNRFYLLGAIVISIAIPFISIPIANDTLVQTTNLLPLQLGEQQINASSQDYWPLPLFILYTVITIISAIRFALNIIVFVKKIKANEKVGLGNAKLVLLDEDVLPHTFLNYIFINKSEYNTNSIEDDLYKHELTHVNQRHTLDILYVEFLKIVFWFNPLLYLYKKAIQLNHEFLADEHVVAETGDAIPYQNLLLSKTFYTQTVCLASNLNFSITKKRFIMMTKNTSRLQAFTRQAAVLPVIAALLLISCSESMPTNDADITTKHADDTVYEFGGLAKQPEFPGGMEAFYKEVGENFVVPEVDRDLEIKVFVTFVVEKDGSMTGIKAVRDPGYGLAKEAERVLKSITTKWSPGEKDGQTVRASFALPIQVNVKA